MYKIEKNSIVTQNNNTVKHKTDKVKKKKSYWVWQWLTSNDIK